MRLKSQNFRNTIKIECNKKYANLICMKKILLRYFRYHGFKKIVVLFLEEYILWFLRPIPGFEGMFLRWLFYKVTFKKLKGGCIFYRNVNIVHTYNIECGKGVSTYYGSIIDGRGGLRIGDNVMIGPLTMIMTFDHDFSSAKVPMNKLSVIDKPTIIEDNVWIGGNCSILGGVTIGQGSIVADGSVVTKDVPPNSIVGGVPAKFIRSRVDNEGLSGKE